jgi:PmbA protein
MATDLGPAETAERMLELARGGAEQADVYSAEIDSTVIKFRAGKFHARETNLTHGFGLRVLRNGRIGFASTTDPDRADEAAEAALAAASYGRAVRFQMPHRADPAEVRTFDNKVIVMPAERLIESGRELCDAVAARVPDMKLDITVSKEYREIAIGNTNGLDTGYTRAELEVSLAGLLVNGGLAWVWEYRNLSDGRAFPVTELADEIERRARWSRSRAKLESGTYPVIFMPQALMSLLLPLAIGANGAEFQKGTSPLIGQEDKPVLDRRLTISDNGLRNWGSGSAPVDDEGVPRRRNVLFDKGEFRGFLFDLVTGAAASRASTGSAERDYSRQPSPGTSNIEVEAGGDRLQEVIAGTKHGLVVYSLLGGGQSNVLAGDVTVNVAAGYRVENGRISGLVKDAMIAGNVYEMLRDVAAIGDVQQDCGALFAPFLALPAVKVAVKG